MILQSFLAGEVQVAGEQVLLIKDGTATDLATGGKVDPIPESLDDVIINNRVRRELTLAIATLKLTAPDRSVRLDAAKALQSGADEDTLPAIDLALSKEADPEIKSLLNIP